VQAIANLVAIAIEHARQQIALGRLEVARRNERLRSVLLDALAHDFLTPLTSVKSAITLCAPNTDMNQTKMTF